MSNKYKGQAFTIPNILCYFRIVLIPLFVWTYLSAETRSEYVLPFILLFVSGLTDLSDGYIARRFNQITDLGKLMDPIADKLTQSAVVISISLKHPVMFILLAVILIKEISLSIGDIIVLRKNGRRIDGAQWYGKYYTVVFYVTICLLLLFPNMPSVLTNLTILFCSAFGLLACILYLRLLSQLYKLPPEKQN